jgi:hypothetical protein
VRGLNAGSFAALLAAAGCSGAADEPPGPGALAISFAMEPDWIPSMDEEPVGVFHGAVFLADDVGPLGPKDGAPSLEGIDVDVDLRPDGGPTGVLHVTAELEPGDVAVLGFLDSDGNADPADLAPDEGDPVTLPGDNTFAVAADAETPVEVFFGLLNP